MELRGGFSYFTHHESVSLLWSQNWRPLCAAGIYPFGEGNVSDFDPVFARLTEISDDNASILYRPDEYAKPFFSAAQQLATEADDATSKGSIAQARNLFLRAAAVYRIARFPINRSALSQEAWVRGKTVYERAGQLLDSPCLPLEIPFTNVDLSAGDCDIGIQAYLRLPKGEKPSAGWSVLLLICRLDAYKTDHTPPDATMMLVMGIKHKIKGECT